MIYKRIYQYPPIDQIINPTKEAFFNQFAYPCKPVIILDAMKDWEAIKRWTPSFFKARYGSVQVTVQRSYNQAAKRTMLMSEYMEYMEETVEDDPYYLRGYPIQKNFLEILDDYKVPEYFISWHLKLPPEIRPMWSRLYIGPANSGSAMHLDPMMASSWNAVISGRKLWLFYPPEQEDYLYSGTVDAFHPDLSKYPLLAKADPLLCIQNPGEIVFTPSGWWHQVINEQMCISITEHYINESNLTQVRKYFRQVKLPDYIMQHARKLIPELFDQTIEVKDERIE